MSERKTLTGGDWFAVGTFLLGALVAVLMGLALARGVDDAQGTGALAAAISKSIGPLPALLAGAGIAWLGARAFLTGTRGRIGAEVLGVLGIAAGLSVVMGSIWPESGGALGAWTGGRVAQMAHTVVGVVLGAIVAFGAAYLVWMREDVAAAAKLAPPRRPTPAPPKSDDGVTIAESAMLFPEEEDLSAPQPIAAAAPARPLYPEDVRLKGQVPSGAKPLAEARSTMPLAEPQPSVYRWTAPSAAAPVATAAARAATPITTAVEPTREEIAALEAPEYEAEAQLVLQPVVEADVDEEPEVRALPPRPSWETTGLDEDDEPVDAYGTPVSLVERARHDRAAAPEAAPARHAAIPRELDAPAADDEAEAPAYAEDVLEVEVEMEAEPAVNGQSLPIEEELATSLDAEMDALEEALVDDSAAEALQAVTVDTEAEEDEDEDEATLLAAEEEMAVDGPDNSTAPAELQPYLSQQDELLEELRARNTAARNSLPEAIEEPVAVHDEDEFADGATELELVASGTDDAGAVDTDEELDVAEDEDNDDAGESVTIEPRRPELAHAAPHATDHEGRSARSRTAAPSVAAPSLFDTLDESAEEEPVQREVVLQPQAAVPAARAEKSPGRGIDPEKKLLVEVGCMFVERGRVAVSMLQRQYDMDFEQACRVLDDLQEMGLIGPYLGGKHREILLTKEMWLEKVGAA